MQQLGLPIFFGFWCLVMGVFSGGILREIQRTQTPVTQLPVVLEPLGASVAVASAPAVADRSFKAFTAAEAGEFLSQGQGRRVVVLWRSQCPSCERMLSKLSVMAKTVPVQAFSLDRDPRMAEAMLERYAVEVPRYRILRWEAGELAAGMGKAGIKLDTSFTLPLVAVVDGSGQVVGQWEGELAMDAAWSILE